MNRQTGHALTIGSCIEDNEAGIHVRLLSVVLKLNRVRMATETVLGLEQMHFVLGAFKSPECGEPGAPATDDGDSLSIGHSGQQQSSVAQAMDFRLKMWKRIKASIASGIKFERAHGSN